MKAIQTRYKGYNLRSRLEARWAVVFDHMGYRWEYEPEGFDLGSGKYLPDFRIEIHEPIMAWDPVGNPFVATHPGYVWVEIKGAWDEISREKFKEFADSHEARRCIAINGGVPIEPEDVDWEDTSLLMMEGCEIPIGFRKRYQRSCPVLSFTRSALAAGRSARFEHGHAGAS